MFSIPFLSLVSFSPFTYSSFSPFPTQYFYLSVFFLKASFWWRAVLILVSNFGFKSSPNIFLKFSSSCVNCLFPLLFCSPPLFQTPFLPKIFRALKLLMRRLLLIIIYLFKKYSNQILWIDFFAKFIIQIFQKSKVKFLLLF